MRTEILTITPEMAKEMLRSNKSNRKLRNHIVKMYAKQMVDGDWHLTGQGITFGIDGQLLDGQHRLSAIIYADVPVKMLVIYDADVVATYDCGLKRSVVDQLYLSNQNFATCVMSNVGVAICKLCMSLETTGGITGSRFITTDELIKWIESNKEEMEWITGICCSKSSGSRGTRRAILYATLWGIYKLDWISKADTERIANIIYNGVMSDESDAPLVGFRTKLLTNPRMSDYEAHYRFMYAIKQHINGKTSVANRYDTKNGYDFTKLKKEDENAI